MFSDQNFTLNANLSIVLRCADKESRYLGEGKRGNREKFRKKFSTFNFSFVFSGASPESKRKCLFLDRNFSPNSDFADEEPRYPKSKWRRSGGISKKISLNFSSVFSGVPPESKKKMFFFLDRQFTWNPNFPTSIEVWPHEEPRYRKRERR